MRAAVVSTFTLTLRYCLSTISLRQRLTKSIKSVWIVICPYITHFPLRPLGNEVFYWRNQPHQPNRHRGQTTSRREWALIYQLAPLSKQQPFPLTFSMHFQLRFEFLHWKKSNHLTPSNLPSWSRYDCLANFTRALLTTTRNQIIIVPAAKYFTNHGDSETQTRDATPIQYTAYKERSIEKLRTGSQTTFLITSQTLISTKLPKYLGDQENLALLRCLSHSAWPNKCVEYFWCATPKTGSGLKAFYVYLIARIKRPFSSDRRYKL